MLTYIKSIWDGRAKCNSLWVSFRGVAWNGPNVLASSQDKTTKAQQETIYNYVD